MRHLPPALALLGALLCPTACGAAVSFSDGTLSTLVWERILHLESCPLGGAFMTSNISGGNPGAHARVSMVTNGCDGYTAQICLRNGADYEPRVAGSIAGIDFSIEGVSGLPGPEIGPALRQNGVVYEGPTVPFFVPSSWTAYALVCVGASQFHAVGVPGAHPDFSATGPTITLGFYTKAVGTVTRTVDVALDNWTVTVNSGNCATGSRASSWGQIQIRYR
jgi:hypothetical protein